ncbi:MAG: DUF1800 domain-containing protein [Casimicrobium sp.]
MRLRFINRIVIGAVAVFGVAIAAAQCPFSLDTGAAVATDDGLVLSRFASGVRGSPSLINATTLTSSAEATAASRLRRFDIDGNGVFDQDDARIIQRYLLGFRGTALGNGGAYAARLTPALIETYIAQNCPGKTMTAQQRAARFLTQATWGPTFSEIDALVAAGANNAAFDAWITSQFNTASMDSHWDYVARGGPIGCASLSGGCDSPHINATMETFWQQAAKSPDQLRQRIAFALQQIFVVSTINSAVDIQPDAHASFLDMTARNAFGNFRTLLEDVSRHPTMGHYLSHFRNEKEDPATGRTPDENYAREILQLFSIGLWELNIDGTRKKDANGKDIPTYNQNDIVGLAKVFTGLAWGGNADISDGGFRYGPGTWELPMQMYPSAHSTSAKNFLGTTIPAMTGTITQAQANQSLTTALNTIFNHPNVGPFIGKQLIKRLVTSNPSPAYVQRVSEKFNNNGSNVRGDMKAVIRAVLMDPEARDEQKLADESFGKLREPVLRFGAWMRAFNATAASGRYRIWNLEDPIDSLGQNPMRSPSVFNFYRPDYAPPGAILVRGTVAPEFQITHETTTTSYANFVVNTVSRGFGYNEDQLVADYARYLANVNNPTAMIADLNLLLAYGQLTPDTQKIILDAVNAIPVNDFEWQTRRVHTAIALTMLAPEFLIQR